MSSHTENIPAGSGNPKSFTANPRAPKGDPINESTGPVASDSLAADSVRDGGSFAQDSNPDVQPVKGSQSTFANTDTSNATTIPPAPSTSERTKMTEQQEYDTADKPSLSGVTNQDGYTGGDKSKKSGQADPAPTYVSNAKEVVEKKPKGDNVTEDNDIKPNTDTFGGDVDSKNNPSRVAEKELLKGATDSSAGEVRDRTEVNSATQYDGLNNSESA